MDRLEYHEFAHQAMKLFNILREDLSVDDEQIQRKRRIDQLREDKIKAYTDELRTNKDFTVGEFLEGLANEPILPREGKKNCKYITI